MVNYKIRFRSGKSLCSQISPLNEANRWIKMNQKWIEWSDIICILGLGSGYHISAIVEKYPNKKIFVIEVDSQIINDFINEKTFNEKVEFFSVKEIQDINELLIRMNPQHKRIAILSFIPAWVDFEKEYKNLNASLIGSSKERLNFLSRIKNPCPIDPVALISSELIK